MFGLFTPKCPVELDRKTWTEYRMRWLADRLGIDRMRKAQVITPTEEFFPGPYHGSPAEVRALMDRLAALMGVTTTIELNIVAETEMPSASGLYVPGTPPKIVIRDSILEDPQEVAATLVHELAHDILLGGGLLASHESDHEQVTDLLLIFLGVGIIPTNNTVKDRAWREGQMEYFQIRRSGYLSAADFGYAFALFAYVRGEEQPLWMSHLRPDAREVMKKGLKFLNKTGDTLFHPDKLREKLHTPTAAEVRDWLRDGTPTEQVFALWQLEQHPLPDSSVIEAIENKLADRDWVIASAAAEALGPLREAAAHSTPSLLRALNSRHPRVRAAAANALGEIGAESEKVLPALALLLADLNSYVVTCAANALGKFGPCAGPFARELLAALDAALYSESSEHSAGYLLLALTKIDSDPEQRIREYYESGNDEHRDHLLEMLANMRQPTNDNSGPSSARARFEYS